MLQIKTIAENNDIHAAIEAARVQAEAQLGKGAQLTRTSSTEDLKAREEHGIWGRQIVVSDWDVPAPPAPAPALPPSTPG